MRILYSRTIYRDGEYATFPNLARLKSGRVICAFRHAKDRQAVYRDVLAAVQTVYPDYKLEVILDTDFSES